MTEQTKAQRLAAFYESIGEDLETAAELRRLDEENERLKAEICKQVAGSRVVFDREIVEVAKAKVRI